MRSYKNKLGFGFVLKKKGDVKLEEMTVEANVENVKLKDVENQDKTRRLKRSQTRELEGYTKVFRNKLLVKITPMNVKNIYCTIPLFIIPRIFVV